MPVNDATQVHLNPLIISVHVPPFRQGLLEHSSISTTKRERANKVCVRGLWTIRPENIMASIALSD